MRALLAGVLLVLAGCQFASDEPEVPEANRCLADLECSEGARCQENVCVADFVDAPLSIALKVTPLRMPDGSEPLSMLLDRFIVERSVQHDLTLPTRTTARGRVREGSARVEAEVSFLPVSLVPGVSYAPVTASTTQGSGRTEVDYEVQLLTGTRYRMLIRPTDPRLPPNSREFVAGDSADLSVDFAELSTLQRRFLVTGVPEDRTLRVGAFDRATGEPISSTGTVCGATETTCVPGEVTIVFSPEPRPFRLEIRAEQSYDRVDVATAGCDFDTPAFPVFWIDDDELPRGLPDGTGMLALPVLPPRIRYEGTVDLCETGAMANQQVESLPVALHLPEVIFEQGRGSPLSAALDITTTAELDSATGKLRFCAQVMPGEYEIVVTPPSSLPCAVFAERRLIRAPDGLAASGALLELPESAELTGTLQTMMLEPLAGAVVEAVTLARSEGIELAQGDPSVTRYNRSRQTTSDEAGAFSLAVDLGSYDVVVRPPAGSGFPWQARHDVAIGARSVAFATVIDMVPPVSVSGTLAYPTAGGAAQASLEGAEIEAFAVIDDAGDGERAIAIAKAVADARGGFTLHLPPSLQEGW